ncbi:hypothetical protein K2173_026705 [Erythroxylum novogranatense]|uniref:Pectin acetylesterase n=1 Tax=Erythroxylum novogranatense TaxID=1862640 RepID=A0AAV8U0S3_9ROSI|nr:hypothetical protein K2173_026705 [Erythroxylum novogranatense]
MTNDLLDPLGHWRSCKRSPEECSSTQINILQGLNMDDMLGAIASLDFKIGGMFINSCFAHCQTELQDTWFDLNSPRINNKTIAETVSDRYFNRNGSKEIDCPYPCDKNCHNVSPVQEAFCA